MKADYFLLIRYSVWNYWISVNLNYTWNIYGPDRPEQALLELVQSHFGYQQELFSFGHL